MVLSKSFISTRVFTPGSLIHLLNVPSIILSVLHPKVGPMLSWLGHVPRVILNATLALVATSTNGGDKVENKYSC